jgi:hypothetical protein
MPNSPNHYLNRDLNRAVRREKSSILPLAQVHVVFQVGSEVEFAASVHYALPID